jgi:hypothetical protein
MTKRKVRSDRNHVIYIITCNETHQQYIGITVMQGTRSVSKTLNTRLRRHFWRANTENKAWALCKMLRKTNNVRIDPIDIIRGKAEAHAMEVLYIDTMNPVLNTKKKA